ncbi:hypothetical protein [Haloferula sp. BvORR071]|uniref:hypothetical protein n=1 Tax=Haloferula sp. BvORR071 TaxID=1396141 RepID=UPI002240F5A0|nr:hypothetical protein [Haloferula sp. BvORR071]
MPRTVGRRQQLLATSFAAVILAALGPAQAVTVFVLNGDHRVAADAAQGELGNLYVDADLSVGKGVNFGTTAGSSSAVDLAYDKDNEIVSTSATEQG